MFSGDTLEEFTVRINDDWEATATLDASDLRPVAWLGVAPVLIGVGGGLLLFSSTDDDAVAVTGGR